MEADKANPITDGVVPRRSRKWVILISLVTGLAIGSIATFVAIGSRSSRSDAPGEPRTIAELTASIAAKNKILEGKYEGHWDVYVDTNKIDGSKTTILSIDYPERKHITARCSEGKKTELFINLAEMLNTDDQDLVRIRYRFDNSPAITDRWHESEDHEAIFSRNPKAFLSSIRTGKKLVIEYSPFEKMPKTEEFDLSGAYEAINPVAKTCGLKLDQ